MLDGRARPCYDSSAQTSDPKEAAVPRTPDNGIELNLDVKYTPNTNRHGHVVPVDMTWDDHWAKALPYPTSPLIRIRTEVDATSARAAVEVLYAKSPDEKIALLLDARNDDVVLFAWTGRNFTDVFSILDVGPALQALGLRPAKVEPIRDASGREWLINDTAPVSNRIRAIGARSTLADFEGDE